MFVTQVLQTALNQNLERSSVVGSLDVIRVLATYPATIVSAWPCDRQLCQPSRLGVAKAVTAARSAKGAKTDNSFMMERFD
jgi:hypothetical protein